MAAKPLIQNDSPLRLQSLQSLSDSVPSIPPSNSTTPPNQLNPIETLETNPWLVPFPILKKHPTNKNSIRTAKYTLFTFLPLQFQFQFSKPYNLYFLVAALTVFTGYSSLSPVNQILPLCIVFFFSAGKEAIEDYARSKADKQANAVEYSVIRNGQIIKILSRNIAKGDIFYIEKGEKIPVDTVVLSSSFEDGTCFIETADLDGETNLKRRNAPTQTSQFNTPSRVGRLQGRVECEHPNVNLNVFNGRLIFSTTQPTTTNLQENRNSIVYPAQDQTISLNMDNILLRGTVLQNTDYVYGLVIFTGLDTKIMRNLRKSKQKTSSLESKLKLFTVAAFVYNAFLLASSVILEYVAYTGVYNLEQQRKALDPTNTSYYVQYYIGAQDTNSSLHVVKSIFSFFALYTYVIPISLFVTIEIARLFQGAFMMWDHEMRITKTIHQKTIKMKMRANNTNLNEELGVVEYIFSDKTGTLTQNDMRASRFYVSAIIFEEMENPGCLFDYVKEHQSDVVCEDIKEFVTCLSVCHSVIPAMSDVTGDLIYESQSPDETALLNAMANTQSILETRSKHHIIIESAFNEEFEKRKVKFEHLATLEFNSDRKRMSVVVRNEKGEIMLYCKGADNIILDRVGEEYGKEYLDNVNDVLTEFSVQGLRTLCVAYKKLTEDEFKEFKKELDTAENALVDREEKVAAVAERIEKNMKLAGCTAIEDRLQDDVPETISSLLKMGIKLWLLTGDKMETAINIGMSSKLINKDMKLVTLKSKSAEACSEDIDAAIYTLESADQINALIINGEALAHALEPSLELKFLSLGVKCHSVICCRVTPLQKARVVKLAKKNLKCTTLAIGDGANDVSMIQAADIGIGIQGREGAQAVRAADYSFAEFRLLSVHGRYSYHRLCQLIFISFYKNITLITVQWYFGFTSDWSGQIAYEEIFLTTFNVIFTSLPPFALAIFDKDVSEAMIGRYPQLYQEIRRGLFWNWLIIASWVCSAVWHTSVTFGTVYLLKSMGEVSLSGRSIGYWIQCYLFGTPLLYSIMMKTVLVTRHWTWFMVGAIGVSLVLYTVLMFVLPVFGYTPAGVAAETHMVLAFYLLTLLNPVLCCLPDFAITALYNPTDADIINEEGLIIRRGRVSNVDIPMSELPNRDPM